MDDRAQDPRGRGHGLALASDGGHREAAVERVGPGGRVGAKDAAEAPAKGGQAKSGRPKSDQPKAGEGQSKAGQSKAGQSKAGQSKAGQPSLKSMALGGQRQARAAAADPQLAPARKEARARKAASVQAGEAAPVREPAPAAGRRPRHLALMVGFALLVVAPAAVVALYLYTRAVDQYASEMGFAVHSEEAGSGLVDLGVAAALLGRGNTSATDTDYLYEYIQTQQIVERIDAELDLRAIFGRDHERDPVFSLEPGATIEELTEHWRRKVTLDYDAGTGLIKVRVLAPSADEAHAIGEAVIDNSSRAVNALDTIAREDTMRHAREDLEAANARLTEARQALAIFRTRTQMIDPEADLQGQMGLLTNLQQQQATALIELDLLRQSARGADPRIEQAELRLQVIEDRIAQERDKLTVGGARDGRQDYVAIIGEYERLAQEKEFAETTYVSALASHEAARAEAQRQSRYLAAYQPPNLPQKAEHPKRAQLVGLTVMFSVLAWAVAALVFYSIRDRR